MMRCSSTCLLSLTHMTLVDECLRHEGKFDILQMRFGVNLGVFVIFNFVSYLDPICYYWAEMPVTGRSERLRNRQCGA